MKIRETSLWTWQVMTGLVLFVLLGLHMGVMHLSGVLGLGFFNPASHDPLDWANVTHRARQWFFTVTYVVLLAAGLFHGLNGLRGILFEMFSSTRARRSLSVTLALIGAGLVVIGTWAAVAVRGEQP